MGDLSGHDHCPLRSHQQRWRRGCLPLIDQESYQGSKSDFLLLIGRGGLCGRSLMTDFHPTSCRGSTPTSSLALPGMHPPISQASTRAALPKEVQTVTWGPEHVLCPQLGLAASRQASVSRATWGGVGAEGPPWVPSSHTRETSAWKLEERRASGLMRLSMET